MTLKLIFPILILVFCLRQVSNAQDSDLIFKNITIANGLSESIVLDIAQDSLGFMWFATPEALNRYDGSEFKIFPKSFDHVTDPRNFKLGKLRVFRNKLWMVTKGGKLEVMNLDSETFLQITHFRNSGDLIPQVRSILIEDENRIWIGTENSGLYLMDRNMEVLKHYHKDASKSFKLISNKINDVFKDSMGDFWVCTDIGINKIENNYIFTHMQGIYSNLIMEDFVSRILVGTQKNGIYITDLKKEEFRPLSGMARGIDFPPNLTVVSLHFDVEKRLWIGSFGDGLYILDNKRFGVTHYLPNRNINNSIANKDLLSIFSNGEKSVWIGTDGGGISFFDESTRSLRTLMEDESELKVPFEQVTAIVSDMDSTVWYGTSGGGFVKYHRGSKNAQAFSIKNLMKSEGDSDNLDRIRALNLDTFGDLWIATEGGGTFIFDTKNSKLKSWFNSDSSKGEKLFPYNTLNCFLVENDTAMWAGSSTGLLLINKEKGLFKKYGSSIPKEITTLARINDNTIAVGFKNSGLAQFNIKTGEFTPIAVDFISENLNQTQFNGLLYLNDWLWAGTAGRGLLATNIKTGKSKLFTKDDGLPSEVVYGILPEDSRTLWVSSSSGLVKLIFKKQEDELGIDRISLYNQKNGFLGNEFKVGAYHKDYLGNLYFGGIRGVNFYGPDVLEVNRNETNVIISDLIINNSHFAGDKSITYTKHLDLDYEQNSIEFNFTDLNFLFQENNNYSYFLEGYDDTWIDAGSRKYAAFTNLEPGNYIFKVRLTNNSSENSPFTSLSFSIARPFWKTAWFSVLIIFLVLGILYLIYRIRINQLMEVQNVKHNISAELHDDLGARLTTLHLLSAISKPKFENNHKVKDLLDTIDREISASSEALDEIVWNIQTNDENLNEVTANIRRYVGETFENYGIDYQITVCEDFGPLEMNMQKRREIFLICKELVNNIRKHAQALNVDMHLGIDQNMFYIYVKDDGKGFDPELETRRNGLANIKERIKKWKGEMTITSEIKIGSKFEIWIPFDRKNLFKRAFKNRGFSLLKYPQKWGL